MLPAHILQQEQLFQQKLEVFSAVTLKAICYSAKSLMNLDLESDTFHLSGFGQGWTTYQTNKSQLNVDICQLLIK
jgi:hypothetical protein